MKNKLCEHEKLSFGISQKTYIYVNIYMKIMIFHMYFSKKYIIKTKKVNHIF